MNGIILKLFTVIIIGFVSVSCAARQKFFYVNDIRNKIMQNLSTSKECLQLQDARFEVDIDENANVTRVANIGADKKDKCMQAFDNAIKAASPFPMPPKRLTKEAMEEGFVIQFGKLGVADITTYKDYEYGEYTYLNVLRYPDIEYFIDLKKKFKTEWKPVPALRRDSKEETDKYKDISVVLAVSVDRAGSLTDLFVIKSSGLVNYDNEALRAIKKSFPFSGPPEKFLVKDGILRMNWTFVVYMHQGSGHSIQVFVL